MTRNPAAELAEEEAGKHLLLAEAIPNLVFLTSSDGAIKYANRAWSQYTGLGAAQSIRPDWYTLVHPADRAGALSSWGAALLEDSTCELELRLRRNDGSYRWHLLRFIPLPDADRPVVSWLASATDIDDRHRAEDVSRFFAHSVEVLSESLNYNQTLRKLVQLLVPSWADICSVDVLEVDRSVQRIEVACVAPGDVEVVRGMHVREWLSAPGRPDTIGKVISRGGSVFIPSVSDAWIEAVVLDQAEAAKVRKLGASSALFVPLRARNRTLGALALVTSESGRTYTEADLRLAQSLGQRAGFAIDNARLYATSRRVAQQLKVASRAKDEFLGLMSHELRTPITTIYGNAHVVQRLLNDLDRDSLASALGDIRSDAERLHLIIENLLALARSESRRAADIEPISVARVLQRMKDAHLRSHSHRQINLQLQDAGACVSTNATHFELVVRNLLNNAEKYSPRQQPIEVRVDSGDGELAVRVLDRGSGIPPDDIESIFHPFFRSPVVRDQISGVGIGLTVCKRLVESQGGRIWALPRDGGGIELGFALPAERRSEADE